MKTKQRLMTALIAIAPVLAAPSAFAGGVTFWEHQNCTGRLIAAAINTQYQTASYGGIFDRNNDEIRSVRLERALVGTVVRLYDARHQETNDDWAQIVVKKYTRDLCIKLPNKERTSPDDPNDPDRKALIFDSDYAYMYIYGRSDWRVEGKVSSWVYDGRMGMTPEARNAIERMFLRWEEQNAGWPQGSRYEYWAQGHEFRMHEPSASPMGNGFFVSSKLDHDRNKAFDNYAIYHIETDAEGKPTKVTSDIHIKDVGVFQLFVDVASEIANHTGKNKYAVAAETAAKLGDKIYNKLLEWTDFGGREVFKNEVQHKLNELQNAIADSAP